MSDTTDVTSGVSDVADGAGTTATATKRRRGGTGLSAMLLPELQSLAASLGISGTARMRKGELIAAITERQSGASAASAEPPRPRTNGSEAVAPAQAAPVQAAPAQAAPVQAAPVETAPVQAAPVEKPKNAAAPVEQAVAQPEQAAPAASERPSRRSRERATRDTTPRESAPAPVEAAPVAVAAVATPVEAQAAPAPAAETTERAERGERPERGERNRDRQRNPRDGERNERNPRDGERNPRDGERNPRDGERNPRDGERNPRDGERGERNPRDGDRNQRDNDRDRAPRADQGHDDDNDDSEGGRRSRRSRFRDRRRGRDRDEEAVPAGASASSGRQRDGGSPREGREPHTSDDEVLVPVAGILDVLDNYAFVRTTGYLSGPNDVYVSMSQVKKYGLRRGDAVTGAVRSTPRDTGDQRRDKYNPLVRLDTINGMEPDEARRRPEFYKLTPLYPQERLRLETEPHILTTRVIDLVMPIGKGQRALIVSPPKAGKTMVLQAIANAITHNNPECHLMVVLVDERPEEVTDMQRSVKGEVVAATFDRPPQDHTTVAELAIERAKRLVELGHDVVVLLDSVTRLGRSYNLAAPASGRIMSGGIDSTALYPPKRFLGAARNIENGGSLTILATALVETGSMMDTVIFEEFKGTGNAELKLDRKIADKRTFPAVDVSASGTRKEEILMGKEELAIIHKLRKVLSSLESGAALDLLLDRLKQTRTNIEFLMQIAKSTPGE
ncbi:transcription termination factor Rho [Actinoplanes lutulentus]|uniref:Transcription termination factor Rho n=1 Tax=Actinoplanes lutulentus TaxID=1287878 RepID=A0A327Z6X7_9ACTN|nr:transcription termination factor Rho [Actinoplanes lutulentus]MBB2946270.1 transcription termination factor Rho [Actinoplanes lutulentus]RAK32957.1 transcription termination factor Rho [Actinoplanes lutulentus]